MLLPNLRSDTHRDNNLHLGTIKMKGKHCANVVKASESVLLHQILSQKGSKAKQNKVDAACVYCLVH